MDWKKYLEDTCRASESFIKYGSLPVFKEPASIQDIQEIENTLRCKLPSDLRELLMQTNGVNGKMILGGNYAETDIFIFSAKAIIETNEWHRINEKQIQPKQSFFDFIFFGTTGVDGIYFASQVPRLDKIAQEVFAWYPIDAEFVRIAKNLEELTYGWLSGKLTI